MGYIYEGIAMMMQIKLFGCNKVLERGNIYVKQGVLEIVN